VKRKRKERGAEGQTQAARCQVENAMTVLALGDSVGHSRRVESSEREAEEMDSDLTKGLCFS
jgi:hypothetical protein